ncbi:MAG: bifunctional 23S rRNA (guanine(2069)-N(7))-methyltransferase RlmK/23S rRNA (guanine(2445)-N(2))-methyltransferase RlmL [Gammaproteobacteria bacterium]
MSTYQLFATAPKAMESIVADELMSLGIGNIRQTVAGVAFQGDLETAYRACLWSRTANRIFLVLSTFEVKTQDDLYYGVKRINWFEHMQPEDTFAVSFSAKNAPAINNTHFGALKVKDAIVDQMRAKFQKRPNIDTERPRIRVNVYLQGHTAQLSLDLSGESLHRRGYRDSNIAAPIKENLAAAILLRSGWPEIAGRQGTLMDPMCGSGTLLIEGAMMAADIAPGLLRDYFGFIGWKKHDAARWRQLCEEAESRRSAGLKKLPVIVGFDQDRHAVNAALLHITQGGLQHNIHIERRDIGEAAPAANWKPGLVVCNPPYGERLGDEQEIAALYKKFGETLKRRFIGWKAALIIKDAELGFRLGIRSQKPVTLFNGALECKLLRMDIEEGAFFKPKAKSHEERISDIKEASQTQSPNDDAGADMFANRLGKNFKKMSKWAKQNRIGCYRLYDADLPEYAVAIDIYQCDRLYVNVQEYEPPKSIDRRLADHRLTALLAEIPSVLGIEPNQVSLKIRRKQKSTDQYEKQDVQGDFHVVEEGGIKLLVNFENYLDTGLFLDHRPIRMLIQRQSKGKRFLNLFGYTGSATVHAAAGGAIKTTTVDMSHTYLNWAQKNMTVNSIKGEHEFIQADCLNWLKREAGQSIKRQYDLIFLDPPTFSNSKRMDDIFDVQRDHVQLITQAACLLAPGGMLYFSTNFRRFKIDLEALSAFRLEDMTASTIPEDFSRNPKIHYCWRIQA